jgi:hypothetical protein
MNIKEFQTLTGKEVSREDFERYNGIYLNAGDLDKNSFCKCIKNHVSPAAFTLLEIVSNESTNRNITIQNLRHDIEMHKQREMEFIAKFMVAIASNDVAKFNDHVEHYLGTRGYLRLKLENGIELTAEDKDKILRIID